MLARFCRGAKLGGELIGAGDRLTGNSFAGYAIGRGQTRLHQTRGNLAAKESRPRSKRASRRSPSSWQIKNAGIPPPSGRCSGLECRRDAGRVIPRNFNL
jgi:hypothetical protein